MIIFWGGYVQEAYHAILGIFNNAPPSNRALFDQPHPVKDRLVWVEDREQQGRPLIHTSLQYQKEKYMREQFMACPSTMLQSNEWLMNIKTFVLNY
jgi:hypothetical protein